MEDRRGSCQSCAMTATPFHCPHCGALYERTESKVVARDQERVICVVCRNTMYESKDPRVFAFKLIKRPEGDTE
jgi:hypothetical protein